MDDQLATGGYPRSESRFLEPPPRKGMGSERWPKGRRGRMKRRRRRRTGTKRTEVSPSRRPTSKRAATSPNDLLWYRAREVGIERQDSLHVTRRPALGLDVPFGVPACPAARPSNPRHHSPHSKGRVPQTGRQGPPPPLHCASAPSRVQERRRRKKKTFASIYPTYSSELRRPAQRARLHARRRQVVID